VTPGVPDIFCAEPRGGYHGLFIEMKRRRGAGSKVSEDQREWHFALNRNGYFAGVCYGFPEALSLLAAYLGLNEDDPLARRMTPEHHTLLGKFLLKEAA
jgi:hypothetical protein